MDRRQRRLYERRRRKKRQRRLFLGCISLLLVILLIFGAIKIFGKSKSPTPPEKPKTTLEENPPIEGASEEENTPKEPSTLLEKATFYADTMHLSKVELYNHLSKENFPADEIKATLEELPIDYKKNALLRAKEYQKNMNLSPDAIYTALVGEFGDGFTPEEGQYALDNL